MNEPPQQQAVPAAAEQTRRALTTAQRQVNILRDQKRALDKQLAAAGTQNQKLVRLLDATRTEITQLKRALENDLVPPLSQGTVVQVNPGHAPVGE